jgi:predicted tellurium resistance membrane protein TerC
MEWIGNVQIWLALVTLTAMEIILGIDNIIFITILAGRLPAERQPRARTVGLFLAMFTRIGLLFSLTWIMRLTAPLFSILATEVSGRDIILVLGGLFLLAKATREIHLKLEGGAERAVSTRSPTLIGVVVQIMLLDIIFSLDSVITAIGMTDLLGVMIAAVVIAVVFMMISMNAVSDFIHRHPTIKMLALSFLLLIGVSLILEGAHQHIPKGYLYFAMAFSVFVEMLNLRLRKATPAPVELHSTVAKPSHALVQGTSTNTARQ